MNTLVLAIQIFYVLGSVITFIFLMRAIKDSGEIRVSDIVLSLILSAVWLFILIGGVIVLILAGSGKLLSKLNFVVWRRKDGEDKI